jgi:hypothetical protein
VQINPELKNSWIEFLKELGFTEKTLDRLTDAQLASLVFEKAGELMKPCAR